MKKQLMITFIALMPAFLQAQTITEQSETEVLTPSAPSFEEIQSVLPESSDETENLRPQPSTTPLEEVEEINNIAQVEDDHFNDPIGIAEPPVIYPGEVTGPPAPPLDIKESQTTDSTDEESEDGYYNIPPTATFEIEDTAATSGNEIQVQDEKVYQAAAPSELGASTTSIPTNAQSKTARAKKASQKRKIARRKAAQKRRIAQKKAAQKRKIAQKKASQKRAPKRKAKMKKKNQSKKSKKNKKGNSE